MTNAEIDRMLQRAARKIVSVEITPGPGPLPAGIFDQAPRVIATLADGATVELFSYFANERSFTPAEFIGLTVDEGRRLKFRPIGGADVETKRRSRAVPERSQAQDAASSAHARAARDRAETAERRLRRPGRSERRSQGRSGMIAKPEGLPAPTACPFCRSAEISTAGQKPNDESAYWRCVACGEMWNVSRLPARGGYNDRSRWRAERA